MSFLGTISNTVNNRVTNKLLEETVAELKTDIVSKERQLQVKTEQLQERNEYILQLEEQLRRVEATNQIPIPPESSNEQQRIETVNAEDENAVVAVDIKGKEIAEEGETIYLKGFVQYHPSVKYIKWQKYHNGEFVDINIHKGKYKGTTNILPNPELVLNDIEKEDGVEFRIKIQRINTAEYSSSHNMKVVRARGTKTRIKVKSDQENNKYYVNEDVTITAEISHGSNILCTTWQKSTMNESVSLDTSLSKYIVTRNNYKHTLTIKNCSELDQGAYFLLAACTYNLEVCSNTIQLDAIQDKPKVRLSGVSNAVYNKKVKYEARIRSSPNHIRVIWRKGNSCIDIKQPKYEGSSDVGNFPVLCINNVDKDDEEKYTIEVTNEIGTGSFTSEKLVVTFARDMIFVAGPVVVSPADTIMFATVFEPLSNPIFSNTRWFKIRNSLKTEILNDNKKFLITNSSTDGKIKKMQITDAGEEDSGGYQLLFANTMSNLIHTFVDDSGRFSTEKEANGLRFFALLTVSADAVRTAFDGIYPSFENKLNKFIQQCSSKTKFKDAISYLKKSRPSSSKTMDLTVMYTIIRNVTNLAEPQNGWGNSPSVQDLGTAADIERIREYRNKFAHTINLDMETSFFNKSALDLIWAIRRLSNHEVQLLEQIADIMNKVFIKGETMAEIVAKFRKFQKETKQMEQLFGYEVSELNFEAQRPYARLSFLNEDLKFHHVHDSCIKIANDGKSASKSILQESKKGVCFLSRCMTVGEKIYLHGHHWCSDNVHHVCFGLTNTYPGSFSGSENIANSIGTKLQPVRVCSNTHGQHRFFLEHLFGEGSCFESFNVCIMFCSDATLSIRRKDTELDRYTPDSHISRSLPLWLVIGLNGDHSLNISNSRAEF